MEHTHNDGTVCNRPHTLEEIGQELGVTRERARQIEEKALKKLRRNPLAKRLFAELTGKAPIRKD